jgi:short subunit dehydrogenase-like uncharacterized protein
MSAAAFAPGGARALIYGANGYTGVLVAREAAARGLKPILAGRDAAAITRLSVELGFDARAFTLDDGEALKRGLDGVGVVLHCAGPFVRTSRPMVDACLEHGAHYLDITGEIQVFEAIYRRDAEAKRRGVGLLPGVGFDVVPSDRLAKSLADDLPGANRLELAFANQGGGWSRGTLITMIEALPYAGAIRKDGKLVPVPPAFAELEVDFPHGRRRVVTIPWGDLASAYRTTGIPNIRTHVAMHPSQISRLRWLRRLAPIAGLGPVKRFLQARVKRRVTGPTAEQRETGKTHLWGRVTHPDGRTLERTVTIAEGYRYTAEASIDCLTKTMNGELPPGSWTPAGVWG